MRASLAAVETAFALVQMQTASEQPCTLWLLSCGTPCEYGPSFALNAALGLARVARSEALLPVGCLVAHASLALTWQGLVASEPEVAPCPSSHLVPRLTHAPLLSTHTTSGCRHVHSHLVTGGTGGLGLLTGRWLAQNGAYSLMWCAWKGGVHE